VQSPFPPTKIAQEPRKGRDSMRTLFCPKARPGEVLARRITQAGSYFYQVRVCLPSHG
jgi:hypothetical protein